MVSKVRNHFQATICCIFLIVVRAKSVERLPFPDAQLLVEPNGNVGENQGDPRKVHHSMAFTNYEDGKKNQINATSEADSQRNKSPDYVNAFATVRDDLNTVKDNLKFLGQTQQMLLESFKTFQLHDPEIVSRTGNTLQSPAAPSPTSNRPSQDPQYHHSPAQLQPSVNSAPAPSYVAPLPAYAEHSPDCINHLNEHNQCLFADAYTTATPQYYANQQQSQQNPNGYAQYVPSLPPLPYGNDDHENKMYTPAPQRSPPPPSQQQPPIPMKTHQRLLPSLLPTHQRQLPSIATIAAKAAVSADLQRLRQLRVQRQFQQQSRAQMMAWRRQNEQQAHRTMSFLQQGLVQAFWTVLTVICVQMAPIVLLVIKLLLKSFLPSLLGVGGDQQRLFAGPFDFDVGGGGQQQDIFGRGIGSGASPFGMGGDDNGVDSFALRRFVQGGFGESQFGGAVDDDRLSDAIARDEKELLVDNREPEFESKFDVVEDNGFGGGQSNELRRRSTQFGNMVPYANY